jgi:hypothetical protein
MKWLVTALIVQLVATQVAAQERLPTTKAIPSYTLEPTAPNQEVNRTVKRDSIDVGQQMTPFSVSLITKPTMIVLSIDVLPSKGANAEVYLINTAGEKVRSYLKGTLKTGKTDFAIDTRLLSAGLYYIVSIIEGRQYAEKITVAAK